MKLELAFFLAGIFLISADVLSIFMWDIESIQKRQQRILQYRISAYCKVFLLGLLCIPAYFYAAFRSFWLILGLVLTILPLWAISWTLVLFRAGRLKIIELSEDRLKREILKRRSTQIAGKLVLLSVWIFSWRYLFA